MSDETTIRPALTEAEWADARQRERDRGDSPEACHYFAAINLHGQPFGFTWADVDALLTAAGCLACDAPLMSAEHARVRDIRARIAALLPPREAEKDARWDAIAERVWPEAEQP